MSPPSTKKTVRVQIFAGPKFDRVLKVLADAYKSSANREALAVPYVVTCAAALEAKLNDAIFRHVQEAWSDSGEAILQAYMSMSFRGKLELVPVLLTKNKFRLNHGNEVVARLVALIATRNKLVHPKPRKHDVLQERIPDPLRRGMEMLVPGTEFWALMDDLSLGASDVYRPEEFHDAVDKLEKWFFKRLPDRVSKIGLLQPNSEA